ncbi:MAG: flavodoxin family protein [Alphaproteobacteria bacterium]|nr:flavodoxin family protein [Alphaproteobacteria bacterium]
MKTLLFVSHAISENTRLLEQAALRGIGVHRGDVILNAKPARDVVAADILGCTGMLIATTENIGYMAGLTKDMFDRTYNDLLGKTDGLSAAFYIRAGHDGTATKHALTAIATGLNWRLVQPPLILKGSYDNAFENDVYHLSASLVAGLDAGIF